MLTLPVTLAAGALIGLSLGALGGGGSILAVPVLVYLLAQSPAQATTGSLVVVGSTALLGALAARREGHVMLGRGVLFGLAAVAGATAGAIGSARVPGPVLMVCFAALMLVVAGVMIARQLRPGNLDEPATRAQLDDPIITLRPTFACACPRALKVLVTATAVAVVTGFLGVGGGFLVVPALIVALGLPMRSAAGTSLVVITITSVVALAVRLTQPAAQPDWLLVAALTLGSALSAAAGARLAAHIRPERLSAAFTGLVLVVAALTATQAVPALL